MTKMSKLRCTNYSTLTEPDTTWGLMLSADTEDDFLNQVLHLTVSVINITATTMQKARYSPGSPVVSLFTTMRNSIFLLIPDEFIRVMNNNVVRIKSKILHAVEAFKSISWSVRLQLRAWIRSYWKCHDTTGVSWTSPETLITLSSCKYWSIL